MNNDDVTRVVPYAPVEQSQTVPLPHANGGAGNQHQPSMLSGLADLLTGKAAAPAHSPQFDLVLQLLVEQTRDNRRLQAVLEKLFWEGRVQIATAERRIEALQEQLGRAQQEAREARAMVEHAARREVERIQAAIRDGGIEAVAGALTPVSSFAETLPTPTGTL